MVRQKDVDVKEPTGVIKLDLGRGRSKDIELDELKPCWWRETTIRLVPGSRNGRKSNPGELYIHLQDLKVSD